MAGNVKEVSTLQVGLELNSKNFTKNMKSVNGTISSNTKSFKNLTKEIDKGEASVEDYGVAVKKGNKILEAQQKKIQILEKEQSDLTKTVNKQKEAYDKLSKELVEASKDFEKLSKSTDATEDSLASAKANVDRLKKALEEKTSVIMKNESSLEKLGNQLDDTGVAFRNMQKDVAKVASELEGLDTADARREIEKLNQELNIDVSKLAGGIGKVNAELNSIESGNAVGEVKKLDGAFENVGGTISDIGGKVQELVSPVDMLVGALGGSALVGNFTTLDNLSAKLRANLGLTAEEAEGLDRVVRNLAGNGYGFDQINETVILLKRYLGDISDSELESIAGQAMAISDAFGDDVNEILRATIQLMKHMNLNAEDAFDIISKGYQDGANFSGEWLDNLSEYTIQMKSLGYTAEDTLKIAVAGFKEGNFNLDKTLDLVKEGRIRLAEMNDEAIGAVDSLGLNSNAIQLAIAQGGEAGRQAMTDVANALVDVEDKVLQNQLGVALFGTQFEDLQINGVKALLAVNDEMQDLDGTAENVTDTMGATLDANLLTIANNFALAFKDISTSLEPIVGYIADLSGKFREWIEGLSEGEKAFMGFATVAGVVLAPLAGLVLDIVEKIANIGGALAEVSTSKRYVAELEDKFKNVSKEIDEVVDDLKTMEDCLKDGINEDDWDTDDIEEYSKKINSTKNELKDLTKEQESLKSQLGKTKEEIIGTGDETSKLKDRFNELSELTWSDIGNNIKDGITNPFKEAGDKVKDSIKSYKEAGDSIRENFGDNVRGKIDGVKDGFSGLVDGVKGIPSKTKDVGKNIVEGIMKPFDAIKSFDWGSLFNFSAIGATISGGFSGIASTILGVFSGLGAGIAGIFAGIGSAITGALSIIFAPVTLIIGAIVALAGSFMYAWNKSEEFRNNVMATFQNLKDAVAEVLGAIWSIFEPAVTAIATFWAENSDTILAVCETVWNGILAVVNFVIDTLVPIIVGFIEGIKTVISIGMSFIKATFGSAWQVIKGIFGTALALIKGIVSGDFEGMKEAIKEIWTKVGENIKEAWDGFVTTVKEKLSDLIQGIKDKASEIWDNITAPFKEAMEWVSEKWTNFKNFITSPFKVKVNADTSEIDKAKMADGAVATIAYTMPEMPNLSDARLRYDFSPVEFNVRNSSNRNTTRDTAMEEQNSLLKSILGALMADKNITVNTEFNLDGRAVASGISTYVQKDIEKKNRRSSRIAGLGY